MAAKRNVKLFLSSRACGIISLMILIAYYAGIQTLFKDLFLHHPISSDVRYQNHTNTRFNIVGRAHDDPLLISYIRSQLHLPSALPYNLSNPHQKDFTQHNQITAIRRQFHEKKGGFFVEAGGFDGETYSNTLYWERENNWTGILIEPDPMNFKKLLAKRRKAYAIEGCLCPTSFADVLMFYTKDADGHVATNHNTSTIQVPCYPLSSILAALQNPTVHLLSLDIEGWELTVLKTVPFEIVDIQVMLVEYVHIDEGFHVLKQFLEEKGFKFIEIIAVDGVFRKK